MCYHGTVESSGHRIYFNNYNEISILLGGTISVDTGAVLVIEAVKKLRAQNKVWAQNVKFIITGKGDCIDSLMELSTSNESPLVTVYGRTSDNEYRQILASCQVGLALKPKAGMLAETTFPSKVIEMANEGLLVLTTDISDVRMVLGNGALYTNSTVDQFIERIWWIVENRQEAENIAQLGNEKVWDRCSPKKTGENLDFFLFN
jgi:glycosyltransferase involved in cell wall biosynthesis